MIWFQKRTFFFNLVVVEIEDYRFFEECVFSISCDSYYTIHSALFCFFFWSCFDLVSEDVFLQLGCG